MRYIKLFEDFENDVLELKFYLVSYEDNIIYNGTSYKDAKKIYDGFDTNDVDSDILSDNVTLYLNEKTNIYKYLESEDYDIEDYPIDEYYDDNTIYKLIKEGDFEVIDSKVIPTQESLNNKRINDYEQEIKTDIINYIKSISDESKVAGFLNSTFYALKKYKDGYIMFRVADHFFNISNINLGKDVIYNNFEDSPQYNDYRNIYGFISVNIFKDRNDIIDDRKGFREKFSEWQDSNSDISDLVKYIDVDISDEIDWKYELENEIFYIEREIDDVLSKGIFDM